MPLRSLYEDDPSQLPPPRVSTPVPTNGGGGVTTGGGSTSPDTTPLNTGGWGGGGFALPAMPNFNIPGAPAFNAPVWQAPTMEQAQQEPGYQFRLGAGQQALDHSAAAKGMLRSGGTLKDITEYGQNFGAQEYQNMFQRAMQAYGLQYQGAKDAYAPQFARWQMQADANKQAGLMGYQGSISNALTQAQPRYSPEPDYSALLGPAPQFSGGDAGYSSSGTTDGPVRASSTGYPWPDDPRRYY